MPDCVVFCRRPLLASADRSGKTRASPRVPSLCRLPAGAADAGSGYGRAFPAHRSTKEVATAALASFIADLTRHMGLVAPIKPQVIITDQGSAFVSHHFREFVAHGQMALRFSSTYTPQQNSHIERMWGYAFGTARVFLAAANLPPSYHPFAVQTALEN